jgi:NAD(P)H-dependent FMN reductase
VSPAGSQAAPRIKECTAAIAKLRAIVGATPEVLGGYSQSFESASDWFNVKPDSLFAVGTGDLVIMIEPTERLRAFLSTEGAGEGKGHLRAKP